MLWRLCTQKLNCEILSPGPKWFCFVFFCFFLFFAFLLYFQRSFDVLFIYCSFLLFFFVNFYCCGSVYSSVSGGGCGGGGSGAGGGGHVDMYPVSIHQSKARKENQSESRIQKEHCSLLLLDLTTCSLCSTYFESVGKYCKT